MFLVNRNQKLEPKATGQRKTVKVYLGWAYKRLMETITEKSKGMVPTTSIRVEFMAGLSTYLALSYIFLLNPILLSKAGISISAGFFATVISAGLATLLMGVWAKLPFAVAPAPSLTTFFVSYVVLSLGLPWQGALAAVVLSGLLSIAMTFLSVRGKLIESIPPALKVGILFAVGGFLIANGLTQAKLVSFSNGFINTSALSIETFFSTNLLILCAGLFITLLFRSKWLKFSGAPLVGILAASLVAGYFGIKAVSGAHFSSAMFSSFGQVDFSLLFDWRLLIAVLIFFIIDFFGGVGKFIGLFAALGDEFQKTEEKKIGKALYVDGIGNVIGGFFGASSLAIFVSSAVGIATGGRTGLTSIFTAILIFASLLFIPLVGTIPIEATSGILVFVGFLLLPLKSILQKQSPLNRLDIVLCITAAGISFFTYGIDKAILFVFLAYTIIKLRNGIKKSDLILIITTLLLLGAIITQQYV